MSLAAVVLRVLLVPNAWLIRISQRTDAEEVRIILEENNEDERTPLSKKIVQSRRNKK